MKMIKKVMTLGLGLVLMGSATFAQSLADAKKAVDAEQYQKATSMLTTLTTTQASKPENYYFLGDLYMRIDEVDSAKIAFNKGVAADAKFALNYIGLGQIDLDANNSAAAKVNFDKAVALGSKDYKTYLYIGKAYIAAPKPDYAQALPFLTKAQELNSKAKELDPEVFIALGDYYAQQKRNSDALGPYLTAINLNSTFLRPFAQIGRMYTRAFNPADAESRLKEAIAIDANYGPAYRELAETQMEWSRQDPKRQKELQQSALENYRKYLSLTDKSFDSRLRYAQFLVYAEDWKTLEEVSTGLATNNPNPSKSLLISRLRAYSAFNNGNYPQALQYINEVFEKSKTDASKLQPSDYAYYGKSLEKAGQDSLAVLNLRKATELDSTNADALIELARKLYSAKKYPEAIELYNFMIKEAPQSTNVLKNYYYLGYSNYLHYYYQSRDNKNPSKDLLAIADSSFAYLNKIDPNFESALLLRAKVALLKDDAKPPVGLAKPFYEQYIQLVTVTKPEKAQDPNAVKGLLESYNYLGYLEMDKDKEKAKEFFNKTLALDPANKPAIDNLKYLNQVSVPVKKATPIKK